MQKLISFFWFCSGADTDILKKCPSETAKYTGIGATVFFTGVFAFLSAAYARYTVFDNVFTSVAFGIVWGLAGYWATRGRRDFSSVTKVVATRYEVLVEHKLLARGQELLAKMPGRAQAF